eukprot:CAMPEP_0174722646 /NCGR_PEP_ID=MMETSP1094-20130205/38932_1 /TAXON_ID=156173 /ORGANISM="Chrysochromulina brevifilum, Strain UTEX LB 985" /LENGTH=177 /DNA_ID=CAMNT_0015923539 /DNA_START=192 /DNA_END=725 /DNA_ORIENTATION=+
MADDAGGGAGADPAMMEKLMASLGGGGGEGEGGMDMEKLQAMLGGMGGMGGMGGGPEADAKRQATENQQAAAAKNAGETEGGLDGKTWKWEQTSKYGESEIIVRFSLASPATKKDVKVVFKAKALKVTVAGEDLIDSKTFGTITIDDCTWCLVEKGSELQVMLALAEDTKWTDLLAS